MNKGTDTTATPNNSCKCGNGWCMHGRRHYVLRALVGIFILAVVFAIGVKVGEFRGAFGRGHFGSSRGGYMMRHYPSPMMRAYPVGSVPGMMQSATTTKATLVPAK